MLDLLMYRGNVLVSSLAWAIILKKTCKVLNKLRSFIFQIVASYTICIRAWLSTFTQPTFNSQLIS